MELNISKDTIDLCVKALKKADPYPDEIYQIILGSEESDKYDKDREIASTAKQLLVHEGIDFNEFMKEYVNKE